MAGHCVSPLQPRKPSSRAAQIAPTSSIPFLRSLFFLLLLPVFFIFHQTHSNTPSHSRTWIRSRGYVIWAQNLEERKGHLLIFHNRGCSVFWGNALFWNIGHIWGQRRRIGTVSQRVWCFSLILKNQKCRPGRGNGTCKVSKAKCPFQGLVCPLM